MSNPTEITWNYESYEEEYTSAHVKEGDYRVKIVQVTPTKVKQGPNEGVPGIVIAMEILDGDFAGQHLVERLYNLQQTAWRHAAFNKAIGLKVAKGQKLNVSNKFYEGKTLIVTAKDGEPFKGNVKSEISAFKPAPKNVESEVPNQSVTPGGASFIPDESAIDAFEPKATSAAETKDLTIPSEWKQPEVSLNGSIPAGTNIQL